MSDVIEELLADWAAALEEVRCEEPHFASILVDRAEGDDGLVLDRSRTRRSKVLWALQYDRMPRDPRLLRLLFEAEIEWHEIAPFQGLYEELSLAAFLLSLDPPHDALALMWRAKVSNFDTYCGFDSRFLGIGGVANALAAARELDDGSVLDYLTDDGEPWCDESEVAEFINVEQPRRFPSDARAEWPFTWFDRAKRSGQIEHASALLDEWRLSDDPPSASECSRLLADVGRYGEAADVLSASVDRQDELELVRLARLQRQAGSYLECLETLRVLRQVNGRKRDWNGFFRRSLVEEGFLLVEAADSRRVALQAFELADGAAKGQSLPLAVLDLGVRASDALGRRRAGWSYRARARRERNRNRRAT